MSNALRDHPKVIALLVAAFIIFAGGITYTLWPTTLPPMPETMQDVKTLVESDAYARLTPEQRRPYVRRVSELTRTISRDERRSLDLSDQGRSAMRDAWRTQMLERARQFAVASPAEQERMIQEELARRAQSGRNRGRPGGDASPGGNRPDRPQLTEQEQADRLAQTQSRIEQWVNEGSAQEMALVHEFMRRVRDRQNPDR